MARRVIRKAVQPEQTGYPSLKEHLVSRRRFLELAGVSLAASSLAAACGRALGGVDGDAGTDPEPDARRQNPEPDADVEIGGVVENPDYYTLRIPETGELYAYLTDGGECMFYVEVATYAAPSYDALRDNPDRAQTACRQVVMGFTYDDLNTPEGVAAAEDDLLEALDELCQELNGHAYPTIEAVTLTLTYLEPEAQIDGGIGHPEYP